MPLPALFAFGAVGAFLAYIIAFLLLELIRYLDEDVIIVKRRLAILILIMVLYVVSGGLFTLAVGASDIKAAVFTGAGWQTIFKGAIEIVSLLTKRLA